uniref:Retrotransposon gag domain-containing protein n=1 Tax=Asparagus officinalis TaxID=4686 RepID=Q2AA08_ASPOF|nr:hypothetical protein 20.t00010 [Asparagus officinalis]
MATPLGTSFSDEEVVAQSDVYLMGMTVETLVVEFDQAKYEEALSSGSLSPKAKHDVRETSKKVNSVVEVPKKALSFGQELKLALLAEDPTSASARRSSGHKRPLEETSSISVNDVAAKALKQAKKNAARRRRRSIRRAHLHRVSKNPTEPSVPKGERSLRGNEPNYEPRLIQLKCDPEWRVVSSKRSPQRRAAKTKRDPQGRVPINHDSRESGSVQPKRDPQGNVQPKRDPQGSVQPKRDPQGRVQPKHDPQGSVSSFKRRPRPNVFKAKRDPRVILQERDLQEVRQVQKNQRGFKIHVQREPISPTQGQGVQSPPPSPGKVSSQVSDLRELLSRGKPTIQAAHSCQCERLISAVLSECPCCAPTPRQSVFDRLTNVVRPAKRQRRCRKKTAEAEYPQVTINMIGQGKASHTDSDESQESHPPTVREICDQFEGVYQNTRTRTGAIRPVNYQKLAKRITTSDEHSAIAESQSSSSVGAREVSAYTTGNHEDITKRVDEHHVMLQAQQETLLQLKDMLAQLLAEKGQKPESSRRTTSKGKQKATEHSDRETHHLGSSSEGEREMEKELHPQSTKVDELKARLNAIANRSELREEGVVRPYPAEWDTAPYPPKFKAPTLQPFDGTGSPNQHIYYFKSQTRDVVANDAILTRLFIGTLKGVAFEWFMKLPAGSIQKWVDLERLFLARFFEDDTEVSVPTLLATKQRKGESIKAYELLEFSADSESRRSQGMQGKWLHGHPVFNNTGVLITEEKPRKQSETELNTAWSCRSTQTCWMTAFRHPCMPRSLRLGEPIECDPEIERTLRHIRKKARETKDNLKSKNTMGDQENQCNQDRSLKEFASPTTHSSQSSILKPNVVANNFGLKPSLLSMV